tara:strand:- start:6217 stop:6525 length:309 start_codon:yes stop_codon:yes gene_type:complete
MQLDVIRINSCVGSGMCCKHSACGFGEWDKVKSQCKFLEVAKKVNDVEIYKCGKYSDIVGKAGSAISPAFGAGCCQSLFNGDRGRILRLAREGSIDLPYGND